MARIRSVHPSLFTDESWVTCSPLSRLLYIGLMTDADDQGLFEWKPLQIKMRLLAGDHADVPELLAELVSVNLIAQVESAGKKLGAIRYFRRFQRPKRPTAQFVLPAELRNYVGLEGHSPEQSDDEDDHVPKLGEHVPTLGEHVPPNGMVVPTKAEIGPQMEDGGWRMGREEEGITGGGVRVRANAEDDWPEGNLVQQLVVTVESPWLDPSKSHGLVTTSGRLAAWRRDGASWLLDVVPVVTGLCQSQRSAVSTWKFFDAAIARSIADTRAALQIPDPQSRSTGPPSGVVAQITAEKAEATRRAFARMDAEHG